MNYLTTFAFCLLGLGSVASASSLDLKLSCKAAMMEMPHGSGSAVYYPNGRILTSRAGTPGATWYYPNGRILSSNISVPGASYYYANGNTFSSSTGKAGASWYYSDGKTITNSGPALTDFEMAQLACDLILESEF